MSRFFRLLSSILCFSLFLTACGDASNTDSAKADNSGSKEIMTVTVGLDDSFPPMGFRDENNELVGFDIDMARESTKRANLNVIFKPIDWSSKEAELNAKRVDMLWNGLTITDYRKEHVLFSEPYMTNHQIIVVRTDSDIANKSDLADKVVGAQDGSSALDAIKADPINTAFKKTNLYADNVTALLDLANKRLDAVVVDEVVGRYYVSQKPDLYKVLNDNFGEEKYGIGFRKTDTELQQKIQKALDEMKADGISAKISEKWFGNDVTK